MNLQIALVNKGGKVFDNIDPGTMSDEYAWAHEAIAETAKQISPTGDPVKDRLKEGLLQTFRQSSGCLIFTEGSKVLSFFYDRPPLIIPRRPVAWATRMLNMERKDSPSGYFCPSYQNRKPAFRIVFNAASFSALCEKRSATLDDQTDDFATSCLGDNPELSAQGAPIIHELSHAATEAGSFLSTETQQPDNKYQLVKTKAFKMISQLEAALYTSVSKFVAHGQFKKIQSYKNKPDTLEDEILAFSLENWMSENNTLSPLVSRFIEHILPYDLELIQQQDKNTRRMLLDSLEKNSPFCLTVQSQAEKIASILTQGGENRNIKAIAARKELGPLFNDALKETVEQVRTQSAILKSLTPSPTGS